ncbi:hypothetical protein NP493_413g01028 [Ridgeia piscesae]|uniref:Uncharacterized protein n=1 Tax=Ridgeia piscesae TaxID=27915 RepID=A0AAD9L106_RIDPI|nr:hypothetical protein NP493_413g01028 [Ridgeia piscesae]
MKCEHQHIFPVGILVCCKEIVVHCPCILCHFKSYSKPLPEYPHVLFCNRLCTVVCRSIDNKVSVTYKGRRNSIVRRLSIDSRASTAWLIMNNPGLIGRSTIFPHPDRLHGHFGTLTRNYCL